MPERTGTDLWSLVTYRFRPVQSGNTVVSILMLIGLPTTHFYHSPDEWHRFPDGSLDRGELHRDNTGEGSCNAAFDIYVPKVFSDQERGQILIVCRNPHSHPDPAPVKTPSVYKSIFKNMLSSLTWKLADATPRGILLDSGLMSELRAKLGWNDVRDPSLADLHPSLGNADHVKRIILDLRNTYFPSGTGFAGEN